ncbi:S-formylglutathione hydrolase [Pseudidiomarina aestuarii]|uniref:S-formylglutathione hydrolase n=1 Tax=Pseudidiomarina aestuarii TaxID=624146 RepID=A0A7Z7ETH1_9GAMM|nr:S-formylglutathione hydrolase [Pseudidiomarina aestuarii]RUO40809.1 S-formylglutathione hydrolase [Pseudidiomarina aestuarii]
MLNKLSSVQCFGGQQLRFEHSSKVLNCTMQFSVFLPPQAEQSRVPALYWLSGLTCTDENFSSKAGAQRTAAELGLALIIPDTSPRGDDVPDAEDGAYDFGLGAGFYVNATQEPFAKHYQMDSYVVDELRHLVEAELPVNSLRSIAGHSMGGHGAIALALRNPGLYRSVSAFAPIAHPSSCPWGRKAFTGYLGSDPKAWRDYDSVEMIQAGKPCPPLFVDQGDADQFLPEQLGFDALKVACESSQIDATLRLQAGYDHSYYFIASFITDHLRFHAQYLVD